MLLGYSEFYYLVQESCAEKQLQELQLQHIACKVLLRIYWNSLVTNGISQQVIVYPLTGDSILIHSLGPPPWCSKWHVCWKIQPSLCYRKAKLYSSGHYVKHVHKGKMYTQKSWEMVYKIIISHAVKYNTVLQTTQKWWSWNLGPIFGLIDTLFHCVLNSLVMV